MQLFAKNKLNAINLIKYPNICIHTYIIYIDTLADISYAFNLRLLEIKEKEINIVRELKIIKIYVYN